MSLQIPELLAPAGSLDKLKVSISYGANAVYLAGKEFGLRSAADNFTYEELREGVAFAHERQAAVYVVLNGFLHDRDLQALPDFVRYLDELKIDAVIVSDVGVMEVVKEHSSIPIHVSTQASCVNSEGAKIFKRLGAERVVLGREVSLKEASKIKQEAQVEVEMFVHGSMCMAYSGNCVISNFTKGRDSNRGGCAHSCRFLYSIDSGDEKTSSYFMSSKDLNGMSVLDQYVDAQIDSIKVEGRMKSQLYAATVSKAYSEALREFRQKKSISQEKLKGWREELKKFIHRSYAPVNLLEKAGPDTIFNERESIEGAAYAIAGTIVEVVESKHLILQVKNAFNLGETLEILPFSGPTISYRLEIIEDLLGRPLERSRPSTLVKLPFMEGVAVNNMVRIKRDL